MQERFTLLPQPVLDSHAQLQACVDSLASTVDRLLVNSESHFLYAYQKHLQQINKDLAQIRAKSLAQEQYYSANGRISYLEKEAAVFREEALREHRLHEEGKLEL
jgi:hypothetical protein